MFIARRPGRGASARAVCERVERRQLLAAVPVGIAVESGFGIESGRAYPGMRGVGVTPAEVYDLAVLPSGKTLLAGDGALYRTTADGKPDVSFGANGSVSSPQPAMWQWGHWNALVPLSGDKALVGGTLLYQEQWALRTPLLARYNADGTPDATFGTATGAGAGIVYLPYATAASPDADGGSVVDLAMSPDGSYLAVGFVRYDARENDPYDSALWKVRPDGTPDPDFGQGGVRVYDLADGEEYVSSLVLRDGGGFYAATTGGILSFDAAGAVGARVGDAGPAVMAAGQGGMLVTARATGEGNVRVERFNPDGSRDPSFGGAAGVVVDFGGAGGAPTSVLVRPDGRVLLAAPNHAARHAAFDVVALGADGSPDPSFGNSGRITEMGTFETPARLAPGPGGRLVIGAGDSNIGLFARSFVLDPGITLDPGGPYGPAVEGTPMPVSASATYDRGTIASYDWDVGYFYYNGVAFTADAQGAATTVTFPDDAVPHNVALRVTTSDGLATVRELPVDVRNAPPAQPAVRLPAAVLLGVPATLSGSGVTDPGHDAVRVVVDFGDGAAPAEVPVTETGTFTATHVYETRGTFHVRVTTSDDDGGSTTVEREVRVVDVLGNVFRDLDDDGRRVPADEPIVGATVYVDTDGDGTLDEGEPRTLTDAAGEYDFTNLDKGTFYVRLEAPFGFRVSTLPGLDAPVVIDDDGPGARRNFGVTNRARITGTVFDDRDADGARDDDEAAMSGAAQRNVYLDLDNDGWYDTNEPTAVPVPGGYVLSNLAPGTYTVRYLPGLARNGSAQESGAAQTFPNARGGQTGHVVTVGAASVSAGHDFGSFFGNTTITGSVYQDYNRDGDRRANDPYEPALRDRVVYLDFDNDGVLDPDESRSLTPDLRYSLGYFLPVIRDHTYTVRTVVPDDWTQSEPAGGNGAPYVITVDPQNTAALQNRDFGTHRTGPRAVLGTHLFYFRSAFSGSHPVHPENDMAIAGDKVALLPGQRPTFANVSSYSRGLNGVMVDVYDFFPAGGPGTSVRFDVGDGTSAAPGAWTPIAPGMAMEVRRGQGVGGSDRIVAVFADNAIRNKWLRVTVFTAPQQSETFYFGHLQGETGAGDPLRVNALDLASVKRAFSPDPVSVDDAYDVNHDGRVNALDLAAVKQNANRSLAAFTPPTPLPPGAPAPSATDWLSSKEE